jgi:diguanylate cyclase (GGDEF)-like protein
MINRLRFPVALAALVMLLGFEGSATADTPISLAAPGLPGSPSVTVTNDGGGIGAEVGAGDTAVGAGTGSNGLSVRAGSRGSSTAPDLGAPISAPVIKPRRPATSAPAGQPRAGGSGGTIFGPPASGPAAPSRNRQLRAGSGHATSPRPPHKSATGQDAGRTTPWPFFELVDRIPLMVWIALAALGLVALALWLAWVRNRRRLAHNAFVDPVTGIANVAAFTGMLDRELERAKRYKRPLGLLLIDVSEPHREDEKLLRLRDTTLREASDAISAGMREADTIAILGNDRFAVICPEATAVSTETVARALSRRLEELRIHVRIGVAERTGTDEDGSDVLARAEADLAEQRPAPGSSRVERILHAA